MNRDTGISNFNLNFVRVSLIQQILIKNLPCVRHCARFWRFKGEQCRHRFYFLGIYKLSAHHQIAWPLWDSVFHLYNGIAVSTNWEIHGEVHYKFCCFIPEIAHTHTHTHTHTWSSCLPVTAKYSEGLMKFGKRDYDINLHISKKGRLRGDFLKTI